MTSTELPETVAASVDTLAAMLPSVMLLSIVAVPPLLAAALPEIAPA
jgi:hypothetical protein